MDKAYPSHSLLLNMAMVVNFRHFHDFDEYSIKYNHISKKGHIDGG